MNTATILSLVAQFGPSILPLIQQIVVWIADGKSEVSAADIELLIKLGRKTADDYLKDEGIQVVAGNVVPLTQP